MFFEFLPLLFGLDDVAAAMVVSGLIAAGSAIVTSAANHVSTNKANQDNLSFSNKQFLEQKYLNRNMYQIQSADLQKAGINPAQANMSSLSSGSYSSAQVPTDYGSIASAGSQLASGIIQGRTQKYVADLNSSTQKSIAFEHEAAETERNKERLEMQKSIEEMKIKAENDRFNKTFDQQKDSVYLAMLKDKVEFNKSVQEAYSYYLNGNVPTGNGIVNDIFDIVKEGLSRADEAVGGSTMSFVEYRDFLIHMLDSELPNKGKLPH